MGVRAAAELAGDGAPAAELRRRTPLTVFRRSKQSGLGSGKLLKPCVIHWGSKRGSTGVWAACAKVQAACLAGVRCSGGSGARYGYGNWRRRRRGSKWCSPRARDGGRVTQGGRRRGPAARERPALVEVDVKVCSEHHGLHERLPRRAVKPRRRSGRGKVHRRRGIVAVQRAHRRTVQA